MPRPTAPGGGRGGRLGCRHQYRTDPRDTGLGCSWQVYVQHQHTAPCGTGHDCITAVEQARRLSAHRLGDLTQFAAGNPEVLGAQTIRWVMSSAPSWLRSVRWLATSTTSFSRRCSRPSASASETPTSAPSPSTAASPRRRLRPRRRCRPRHRLRRRRRPRHRLRRRPSPNRTVRPTSSVEA